MTTSISVGAAFDLKTGADWIKAATAKHLAGDDSYIQDVLIRLDAGTFRSPARYVNDAWWVPAFARSVTIDGSGPEGLKAILSNELPVGMPMIKGLPFSGSAGDKGLIYVRGKDTTIRGMEVVGARTLGGSNNGAGIRVDRGTNLLVEDMIFRHNQNGMLVSPEDDPATTDVDERGTIVVRRGLFDCNGSGGQAHGIYCGTAVSLLIEDTVFTNTVSQGNSVKSRADATTIRNTTVTTGSGYNSYEFDCMGGAVSLQGNRFQKLDGYSSQPKNCVHIYNEPQSKPTTIDIQWNVFDLRGRIQGHPIIVDPRVLLNGDGGIGLDGLHHGKGDNYYLPNDFRTMDGIVDNNLVLINADQAKHFGVDPSGKNRMCFTPNDQNYITQFGPVPFPSGLIEGPNNRFIVLD